MAKNNKPAFTPTFRKYADMTDSEQAAFRQGASMVDNGVKERLGLKKPRDQKSTIPATPLTNSAAPKSPLYAKYLQIKAKNKGALLFYRVGDFYEVLGEDAKTVSNVLQLTLTSRNVGNERVLMCGVPFHSLERYLSTLIQSGYKVAVAEG